MRKSRNEIECLIPFCTSRTYTYDYFSIHFSHNLYYDRGLLYSSSICELSDVSPKHNMRIFVIGTFPSIIIPTFGPYNVCPPFIFQPKRRSSGSASCPPFPPATTLASPTAWATESATASQTSATEAAALQHSLWCCWQHSLSLEECCKTPCE